MRRELYFLDENLEKKKPIRIGKWMLSIIVPPILFWLLAKVLFNGIYDFIDIGILHFQGYRFGLGHAVIALLYLIPIQIYFKIVDISRYKKGVIFSGAVINIIMFTLIDISEMYYYGAGSGWQALGGLMIVLEASVPNLLLGSIFCIGVYTLMKSRVKLFFPILFIGMAVITYYF